MNRVRVRVPASTANLGPGFDSLALALDLYNEFVLEEIEEGLEIEIEGQGAEELARDDSNLILRAANVLFQTVNHSPAGLRLTAANDIPLASGLGSSAAAIVAGLTGAAALVEQDLPREEVLSLALTLESHADNLAAALYGGLNLVVADGQRINVHALPAAALKFTVIVPDINLSTENMRAVLPQKVSLEDAVFNIGRSLLMVEALREGDMNMIRQAADDRLHQPYRKAFIPGYENVIDSGRSAGAAAVVLSGAGPALLAFAAESHEEIGHAMWRAFSEAGTTSRLFYPASALKGVEILDFD